MGKQWKQWQTLLSWALKITVNCDCSHEIKRRLFLGRKAMTNLDSTLKSRDITLPTKVHLSQNYGFSSSHVWIWELDHKVERGRTDAFELWCWRKLESPLDCKIKSVNPKENQSWIFIGRTNAEAEATILWPPDEKNWPLEKTLMLGKIEGRRRRGQQRMRWLDGINHSMRHESEQASGADDGQGSLARCSEVAEWDTNERLNWTEWRGGVFPRPAPSWSSAS